MPRCPATWGGHGIGPVVSRGVAAIALTVQTLAGCSKEVPTRGEVERPVKTMVVTEGGDTRTRVFPGKVEASQHVVLTFQVPGLLVDLPVKDGQRLAKGDLVAQLRHDEFKARLKALRAQLDQASAVLTAQKAGERPEEILRLEGAVRAAEAKLNRARTEYERIRGMHEVHVASGVELEQAQTTYLVAREEHKAAIQALAAGSVARAEDVEAQKATVRSLEAQVVEADIQLKDTTMQAPYDGVISQVLVRRNQSITPNEPIVRFQDVDEIEVDVDVPEGVMTTDIRTADIVEMEAEFSGVPGRWFPVHVREVAQAADPVTQTFRVRVAMRAPKDVNLLPGMTARVMVTYRRAEILRNGPMVPVAAVAARGTGEQVVWVIGPDGTATARPVKVGNAAGGDVEIVEGLQPGDRIAVAGVSFLRDGMKVHDLGDALGGGQQP